jgi:surfeit locus 1 family protein
VSRRRNLVVLWPIAVLVIAAFCALGFWQLGRMHQKQAMLDDVDQALRVRRAHSLAAAADVARTRGYDWVAGEGQFADAPAVLLDNQQRDDRAGVRAYRVFLPSADAAPLLVELGWLPLPGDRRLPAIPNPRGTLRIAGLLVPRPPHGLIRPVAAMQPGGSILTIGLDAANLSTVLRQPRLAPRVLKLDPRLPIGYARDLDILPNTLPPERHLGYAVQWFAMAAAVLAIALLLTLRKPKPNPGKTPS